MAAEVDTPGFRSVGVEISCRPDVADQNVQWLHDAVTKILEVDGVPR